MSDDPTRDALEQAARDARAVYRQARDNVEIASRALFDYDEKLRLADTCAAIITETWFSGPDCRCARKNGHGLDGKYCWQHAKKYPAADQ